MKYYLIAPSVEEDEVGEYPQTTGTYPGYNRNAPNSMENLTSDCFPHFIPDLRFIIDDNAILTDVVSPSNLDFAFCQAEDGIPGLTVTGVQTCALPICWTTPCASRGST